MTSRRLSSLAISAAICIGASASCPSGSWSRSKDRKKTIWNDSSRCSPVAKPAAMRDGTVLLRILQEGDSFFPSGSVSFSWGLETLSSDGMITNEAAVEAFLTAQLRNRWANFDRIRDC